jgi:hypothetical protein
MIKDNDLGGKTGMRRIKTHHSFILGIGLFLVTIFLSPPHPVWADHLVSNVDGKIRVIILHYGNGGYYRGMWFDETVLFRELLDKMDKDVGFVILVGKDYKSDICKQKLESYASQKLPDGTARVKYMEVDVKTSRFYPWARDGYFILTNENLRFLLLILMMFLKTSSSGPGIFTGAGAMSCVLTRNFLWA